MFDRLAILTAYNVWSQLWGWDAYTHGIQARLSRLGFRATDSEQTLEGLSPEAKVIYGALTRKHQALHVAYERLRRRHPEVFPAWPGTRNIKSSDPYREFVRACGMDPACLDCWRSS